jgi:hypothetical protein
MSSNLAPVPPAAALVLPAASEAQLPDVLLEALSVLADVLETAPSSVTAEPDAEPFLDEPRARVRRQLACLEASERLASWAHAQGLSALAQLRTAVEWEVERRIGLVSGEPRTVEEIESWSRDALAEEVRLATGWSATETARRIDLASNIDGRADVLLARLSRAETTLSRALVVHERASGCDPEIAKVIADRVLAPDEAGVPVTHERFTRELRRQLALAEPDNDARRQKELARRTAHADLHEDGTGQLTITGDGARVVVAMERLDSLARAMRADGDCRNLAALRADLALDLLTYGRPDHADYVCFSEVPAARVNLTVSLATLVGAEKGVGEIPGYGFVSASQAREIALTAGSVWRRIVTDPTTGAVLDISSKGYRPTAQMRAVAAVLDGTCRGPGCTEPTQKCDLDHQVPWPLGTTKLSNLNHKHRRHHNLKTRRLWTCDEPTPGVLRWETLAGREYLSLPANYADRRSVAAGLEEVTRIDAVHPPPPF